jgi:hypothetical protein
MRACLLLGFVALAFGLAAHQLEGELTAFALAHVGVGVVSLLLGLVLVARRLAAASAPDGGGIGATAARRSVLRGAALVALAAGAAGAATIASERAGVRFDLTFERRYELAEATTRALEVLGPGLRLSLYADPGDPRIRRTRLLLSQLAAVAGAEVVTQELHDDLEDVDRYGVGTSNSVVLVRTDAPAEQRYDWELVERPTEGSLFEALARLTDPQPVRIYALVGTGEGDLERSDEPGYSGLAAAIRTEGYELVTLPSAFISQVPADAAAILAIAPARRLADDALAALRRYLEQGGRLVAFLEPGSTSGLEALLAEYGLRSPDALVVDPASADVDGAAPMLSPIAFHYAEHPITRGLNRNRVTFFQGARSFELRKPEPDDRLRGTVTTSAEAWLTPDIAALQGSRAPQPPPDVRTDYHALVAAGEYRREGAGPTRIVAFGDSDLASNRYLRALYNLDLVMNALHWATQRESDITIRPKLGATIQFPIPVQNSLTAFYGVGMLIPELLLITGGLIWLRQRGA